MPSSFYGWILWPVALVFMHTCILYHMEQAQHTLWNTKTVQLVPTALFQDLPFETIVISTYLCGQRWMLGQQHALYVVDFAPGSPRCWCPDLGSLLCSIGLCLGYVSSVRCWQLAPRQLASLLGIQGASGWGCGFRRSPVPQLQWALLTLPWLDIESGEHGHTKGNTIWAASLHLQCIAIITKTTLVEKLLVITLNLTVCTHNMHEVHRQLYCMFVRIHNICGYRQIF